MLRVEDLTIRFHDQTETEEAVHGISFSLAPGEILGLVGESGSGKTVTALAVAGLLGHRAATVSGRIFLRDTDLLTLKPTELRQIQGRRVGMVFQEPQTALNPLLKVGRQVEETLRIHTRMTARERRATAIEALSAVEIADPERVYTQYPHELSGGMRQRAMLAAAMLTGPELLICDEPTTALDVTTQAQILSLLQKLNRDRGMSLLFISHDLGVVRRLCHRAIVMQDGHIVEQGLVETLFSAPQTAYTKQLLASLPGRRRRRD